MMKTLAPPPTSDTEAAERNIKVDRDGLVRCRVCGCTEREPCCPPCAWFETDLCSLCAMAAEALSTWMEGAHRRNIAALMREVRTRAGDGA